MLKNKLLNISIFTGSAILAWSYLHSKDRPIFSHKVLSKSNNIIEEIKRTKNNEFPQFMKTYFSVLDMKKYKHFISPTIYEKKNITDRNTFVIKIVKFNSKVDLRNKNGIFKNLLFSIIDSQLGYFSALLFGIKPCATAYLGYDSFEELEINKEYIVFAFQDRVEGKNAFVNACVLDENGKIVMKLYSRFVKIDWKNSFKIKS